VNDHTAFAFNSAIDTAKQFMALSTGMLALEIAFVKDFFPRPEAADLIWLKVSWIALTASVVCGLWTHMAVTGTAARKDPDTLTAQDIYSPNVTLPALLQLGTFTIGLITSVVFAWRGL
jgi:hypothetical protein